jgi:hypothetical protein
MRRFSFLCGEKVPQKLTVIKIFKNIRHGLPPLSSI